MHGPGACRSCASRTVERWIVITFAASIFGNRIRSCSSLRPMAPVSPRMNRCRNSENALRFRLFLRPDAPGSKRIWNRCEGRRSTRSGNRHRDTEDTKLRKDGEIRVSDLADALNGSFLPAQPFPRLGAPEGCSENVFVPSAKI